MENKIKKIVCDKICPKDDQCEPQEICSIISELAELVKKNK